jgi:hypothetical protein
MTMAPDCGAPAGAHCCRSAKLPEVGVTGGMFGFGPG